MINIYTKNDCIWCEKAKTLLKENDIHFKEYVIGKDVTRSWVIEAFPTRKTVPIITEGHMIIGGYDDLKEKLALDYNFGKTLLLG